MEKKVNIKGLREEVLRKINVIFRINNPQKDPNDVEIQKSNILLLASVLYL